MRKVSLIMLPVVLLFFISCTSAGDCQSYKRPAPPAPPLSVPFLSVSSDALEFMNVDLTSPKALSLVISNTGDEILEGLTIDPLTGEFAISSNTCPAELDVSQDCVITVTFAPTSIGDKWDTFKISSTNAGGKYIILTGIAKSAILKLDKKMLFFGSISKTNTKSITIDITQSGTNDVENLTISPHGSEYSILTTTCGSSLAIGGSCSVTVSFTPNKSVYTPAKLSISSSNAGDYEIPLVGNRGINVGYGYVTAFFDDGLYAWGSNAAGVLGIGNADPNKDIPSKTLLPAGVSISDKYQSRGSLIIKGSDGSYYSWGYNGSGELGQGDKLNRDRPTKVEIGGGVSIVDIYQRPESVIAKASDNNLYAWGDNRWGQLGVNDITSRSSPEKVLMPAGVTAEDIYFDGSSALVKGSDNKYYSWGDNNYGMLGVGDNTNRLSPAEVLTPPGAPVGFIFTKLYMSGFSNYIFGKGSDNKLYAWGRNHKGQLGTGDTANKVTPAEVLLPDGVSAIEYTDFYFLTDSIIARAADGEYYAWGDNGNGQLGLGLTDAAISKPTKISISVGVKISAMYVSDIFALAKGTDNKIYAWGANAYGQIGVGDNINKNAPTPVLVPAGVTFTDIYPFVNMVIAKGSDDNLYSWGENNYGQLGAGDNFARFRPAKVKSPADVTFLDIYGDSLSFIAFADDGNFYAWGNNNLGKLGVGNNINQNKPTQVVKPAGSITPKLYLPLKDDIYPLFKTYDSNSCE